MFKILSILILALLTLGCGGGGKGRPIPLPPAGSTPTPEFSSPAASPVETATPVVSPTPGASATPYPTPELNPVSYFPQIKEGPTITVSFRRVWITGGDDIAAADRLVEARQEAVKADDLGIAINAAYRELGRYAGGKMAIQGGGSIKSQGRLRHHAAFDESDYSLDIEGITDYGAFLIDNETLVEGTCRPHPALIEYFEKGNGRNFQDPYLLKLQSLSDAELTAGCTKLLEPTYSAESGPAIIVFQALGDSCCSHTEKSENIAVVGFHIQGRQKVYDGGVRSTVQFGNCHHCVALFNVLTDTGSIGISFGGSGLEKNHFSNDVIAWGNTFSGVAAANTATVNTENAYVYQNYVRRPGHHDPIFGGGVCGHDHETNSTHDHTDNIWVYNNLFDYEGAHIGSAGSAICLQVPYPGHDGKVFAVNNVAIGGRMDNQHRWMSNGLFLNKLTNCTIINNYVYRTGQNAIQSYGLQGCLIQDNDFESTGSSTNTSIWSNGTRDTIFRRNNWRERVGLGVSVNAGIEDICGERNVYEGNLVMGHETRPERRCP